MNRDLRAMNTCVRQGMPVPADVMARLLNAGIDIGALQNRLGDIHALAQPQEQEKLQ